jgi:hypothetical protein
MAVEIPDFCRKCRLSKKERALCLRLIDDLTDEQRASDDLPCRSIYGIFPDAVSPADEFNNRDTNPFFGTATNRILR